MPTYKGTPYICTERLLLRRFEICDFRDMYNNWASDERVTKYLTWNTHKDENETKSILENWTAAYISNTVCNWAMEYQSHVIGNISIVSADMKNNIAELGYCMGYDYWNKGLMTEAVKAVIHHLFCEVGVNRIVIRHVTENHASGKVAEKCGMSLEATAREAYFANGEYCDLKIWSILRREYKAE